MSRKKRRSLADQQRHYGLVFLSPFMLGSIFFILYTVALSIVFSVSRINMNAQGYQLEFVGADNYYNLLRVDPNYLRTLWETLSSMAMNLPVVLIFSFFIASMLNQPFRGRSFVRAVLFLPVIVASNAVQTLMSSDVLNSATAEKGSSEIASTVDFAAAFSNYLNQFQISPTITNILVSAVNNVSTILAMSAIPIIIFLAGLQAISPSIYEASYVEGATKWEVFWKISLPMISPLILVVVIYCIIDSFTGADNQVIASIRSCCFKDFEFGKGSAMIWIYLSIVLVLMAVLYFIINRFVFYYDE